MARDYVDIGPSPCDESCVSIKDDEYIKLSRLEGRRFIDGIRRVVGIEPLGARLVIKQFPHDFGSYASVCCCYDDNDDEAATYAYRCEAEAPRTWADCREGDEVPS